MPNQIQKIIEGLVKVGWSISAEGFNSEYAGHSTSDLDDIDIIDPKKEARKEVGKLLLSLLYQEIQELEGMKKPTHFFGIEVHIADDSDGKTSRSLTKENESYNKCLTDLITKKKQLIKELEDK